MKFCLVLSWFRVHLKYVCVIACFIAILILPYMKVKKIVKLKIENVGLQFDKESLYPYHFKGGSVTQLWQSMVLLQNCSGVSKIGLGTQSPLWADKNVLLANTENDANILMYTITKRALMMVKGESFESPIQLIDDIFDELYAYGKQVTNNRDLNESFILNALVSLDNAAWLLFAHDNDIASFDELIPEQYREGLMHKQSRVAAVPAFSVGAKIDEIKSAVDKGFYVLKLKTGSAGTQQEMLEKDIDFFTAVHKAVGDSETAFTQNNKIQYCVDPNGRYESKETLQQFLDAADQIGALNQIAILEEPLEERNESYVGDLGVPIAADECVRTHEDVVKRVELGYTAIAVKVIAKTLSKTLKVIHSAHQNKMPCFCADLTVNPILLDWNKCISARLNSIPSLNLGFLESNGHQYYKNWNALKEYHPRKGATWTNINKGSFELDQTFYDESGGIFLPSTYYSSFF